MSGDELLALVSSAVRFAELESGFSRRPRRATESAFWPLKAHRRVSAQRPVQGFTTQRYAPIARLALMPSLPDHLRFMAGSEDGNHENENGERDSRAQSTERHREYVERSEG